MTTVTRSMLRLVAGFLLALTSILSPTNAAAPPLTGAECAGLARSTAPAVSAIEVMRNKLLAMDYRPVAARAPNDKVRTAMIKAEATQKAVATAMTSYVAALQDMTYQLQLCGRD